MIFFKQHIQTGPTVVTGMTALMDNRFGTLTHDGFNCEWILRLMGANITVPTTRSGFPTLTGRYEQIHTYSPETLNGFTVIFQGGDPTVDAQWVQRHNRARFLRYMSFHRGPRLAQLAQDIESATCVPPYEVRNSELIDWANRPVQRARYRWHRLKEPLYIYKAMWDELVGNTDEPWEVTRIADPMDLLEGKSDIDGNIPRSVPLALKGPSR